MPKRRMLVEVDYPPVDEEGDLESPEWVLDRANEEYEMEFTLVSLLPEQANPGDQDEAKLWHENNCTKEVCAASDEVQVKYPCPVYVETEEIENHGVNLSVY